MTRPLDRSQPTGVRLVRLADIPLETRLAALAKLLRSTKTSSEALELYLAAVDPGDKGGRVAA